MSQPLFRNLAYFTDIHFGRNGNNPAANADSLAFVAWFIAQAKARGCETCVFGGDWFDNRNAIHLLTLDAGDTGLGLLSDAFERVVLVPGNHDLFYRERRDVASVGIARKLPNVVLANAPVRHGEVALLPWLCGDAERAEVAALCRGARYVFGHLEVPGFLMNGQTEMPDSDHATRADSLRGAELVVTGHFHKRQRKGNILYAGNTMPLNFGDAWDDERGAMFLTWGGEPEFVAWPDQPTFRTGSLSDLLAREDDYLRPGASVRVALDIEMSVREAQDVRDALLAERPGVRRLEIIPEAKAAAALANPREGVVLPAFRSVDEMVIEGLRAVEGAGLDPDRLVAIWRELAGDVGRAA